MVRKARTRWWLVAAASMLASCSVIGDRQTPASETGHVLFDSFELDDEWGYELRGIFVDADGLVWRYRRDEPWFPSEQRSDFVGEADLLRKHDGAVRVGSVDPRVLAEMVGYIEAAAQGRVTRDPLSFERSGKLDVAYLYDARLRRYQHVFLSGSGNWVARNHSREARRLVEWLREVRAAVGHTGNPTSRR